MSKTIVIHHGKCIDGFTAAWVAWLRYGDSAEYVAATYGEPPPDVTGADVLVVDFSYPRDVLLEMHSKAKSLRVFDHHRTAQQALAGLDFCVFDMDRSGAGITWDELMGADYSYRSQLVGYVEDRVLWRFALPFSREVNAYVSSYPQTFSDWSALAEELDEDWLEADSPVPRTGKALLRAVDRYVHEMSEQARVRRIGQWVVPVVNAPYINTSELVGHLAETRSEHPFAAGWFQWADGLYAYSLRSRGEFDVAAVAKLFGGGGHKNAAGFAVPERVDTDLSVVGSGVVTT